MFPVSKDIELGLQISYEIERNPREYPILYNSAATRYVQGIVNEILKSPEVKHREEFAYKVKIIKNDKILNAFCTPGGYIYVYTGLLKALDNEASLAAVLAHEIAHAEKRHSTQRLSKAYGAQILAGIALGDNPDAGVELAANLFTGLALLHNSRADEYESDEYSFKYLKSTIWYPGAVKFFFEKILNNRNAGYVEMLLSTHPLPPDRVEEVNKMIENANIPPPVEKNLMSREYRKFLKLLD